MQNKYLSYISDEHLLKCIANLHKSYIKAKNGVSRKRFYKNKIDTIKLTFDSKFNNINEESLINTEILRQIDKSINNFIGTFHEDVLGGIAGFEKGNHDSYDIKAVNNSLFADIKNKHNTMNSKTAESLFNTLADYADRHRAEHANCYWVQILAKSSFNLPWTGIINKKECSHSRVFKISGDQFYALLTRQPDALFQLYKVLPLAIRDYLTTQEQADDVQEHSALSEILTHSLSNNKSLLDQITLDNYKYYHNFKNI